MWKNYEKAERREYWRRAFSFKRIKPIWWVVILIIYPITMILSIGLNILTGGSEPVKETLIQIALTPQILLILIPLEIISGPISEEFGWRGYGLDRMQENKNENALLSSVIIGLIVGVGYLWPLFFVAGIAYNVMSGIEIGLWILYTINESILMVSVRNNNQGSILAAIMLHFMGNLMGQN